MNVCMCITKGGVLFYTLMFTVNFIRFFFSLLHSVNDHLMSGTQVSSLKKKTIMLSNVLLKIWLQRTLILILMNELVKLLGWY